MTVQREWLDKDYYQVLGVSPTASDKEITSAYRKLAKRYHPDANPGAEDRFKEITAAYDVLGDPAKRKEYDEVRRLGVRGLGDFGAGGGATFRVEDLGNLGDLLGGIGSVFGRSRSTRPGTGPRRGADVEAELHLSFEDAVRGVTTDVNVTGEAACATCGGTGAAPGSRAVACKRCKGRGVLEDNQGLFSLSRICPDCGGRGTTVDKPCPECRGTGVSRRTRKVKVRIPPGVEDGQRIRVKGRGSPGRNNGPPGDLYVTVHTARHPVFGRKGRNLTIEVPISFAEAALGTTVTVPTLDQPVTLKIPPGTSSGQTFRVRGRGVSAGGGKGAGDLLVTVEVLVPKTLTPEQRAALEQFARLSGTPPRDFMKAGSASNSSSSTSTKVGR
jgi:molecular chaperone DnaJ